MKSFLLFIIIPGIALNALANSTSFMAYQQSQPDAKITGRVIDKKNETGLAGVNVTIKGTSKGTSTDSEGDFIISNLHEGRYTLVFHYIGYAEKVVENVFVAADGTVDIGIIKMTEQAFSLQTMIVSAGSYSILERQPSPRQTLTSEDIKMMGWADDLSRAIQRVPGISGNDFTAKFNVRGGEEDEVLVLLDGMQIYEPFHQKDFGGGLFSTIDIETIGKLNLLTGGYTAEYGDRMSGVLDMQTKEAKPGETQNSIGLSLLNVRGFSMGTFDDNKGAWLFSARRGYLDLINKLMSNEFKLHPSYYDMMGKASYKIHKNHTLSAHVFLAQDSYNLDERVVERGKTVPNIDNLDSRYGNKYGWLTLNSTFQPQLHARTLLYGGLITQDRFRHLFDDDPDAHFNSHTVNDNRDFKLLGLKQDWGYEATENLFLKFGIDFKLLNTKFDYSKDINNEFITADHRLTRQVEQSAVQRAVDGNQLGLYTALRFKLFNPLTLETGIRYNYLDYTGDELWSPRVAAVYALSDNTFLRAGWGYYYQPQTMYDLRIEFDKNTYRQAERSKHTVLGIEHYFNNGLKIRAEGYIKHIDHLQDRFITFRNIDEFFAETRDDLFKLVVDKATAKGIELSTKYDAGKKVSLWLSYVLSYATDQVKELQYSGPLVHRTGKVPRPWDQRHTINLDANYRLNRQWHFNFSWQYRTGWPYTPFEVKRLTRDDGTVASYKDYGVYNSKNYPAYHRLDVKVSKYFYNRTGKITTFLHVINALNHQNVNNYDFSVLSQSADDFQYEIDTETWFGILPLVGVSWDF